MENRKALITLNDLGIGVLCGPLYVATFTREIWMEKSSCFLTGLRLFVHLTIGGCALTTLIIMNFGRYFAIFHREKVTKGRLVKCMVVAWLFKAALLVAFIFWPFDVFVKLFVIVETLFNMAALVYIYARIYLTSRRSFELSKDKEKQFIFTGSKYFGIRTKSKSSQYKACQILLYCSGLLLYMLPALLHHFK